MADLVYMTKATWTAITDAFRNKLGSAEMIKAGDIPSALNSFQKYVDMISDSVTSVSDENVTLVRSYGFYDCKKLQEVYLPNVTSIGESAFRGCDMLSKINIQNVEMLGAYALAYSHKITELYLPKAITIGESACEEIHELKKVTLGNVKTIGVCAFFKNTHCKEIDISLNENVGSIGSSAFCNCGRLSKLTIRGTALIELEAMNAFANSGISLGTGRIYVDPSMVEIYKTATNWSLYASVIEAIP